MKDKIYYAPILIPTLCRYEHFVRCIESLKKNDWARYTDIFIALDYPSKPSHEEGYIKICSYLNGAFNEFASFNIIKRTENYGAARNSRELVSLVLEKYDRFIRTDDDCEFSPNFIEYMDKCLKYYESDSNVVAVNGYSYPVNWKHENGCNVIKSNFVCSTWGVGFWKDRYIAISDSLREGYLVNRFDSVVKDGTIHRLSYARLMCAAQAGLSKEKGLSVMSSDVAWGTYLMLENKYVIMPILSKVRNYGFDGTGEYCQDISKLKLKKITAHNYNYAAQPIDKSSSFNLISGNDIYCKQNKKLYDKFDTREKLSVLKVKFKILLYRILGRNRYFKLRDRLYNARKQSHK